MQNHRIARGFAHA